MFRRPLTQKFEMYHAAHPYVYELFSELTRNAAKRHKKVGAAFIIERIRWEMIMGIRDEDGFKINDNFAAFYARMFMKDNPGFNGYFNLRSSIADFWIENYP